MLGRMTMSSDTRDRLLRAGIGMLHETGVVAGVDHVKLADACERAGYTTGAAYRCWPTQADFHHDLAIAALEWRDRPPGADTVTSVRPLLKERAPLLEALRVGAEANVYRLPQNTDFYITLALRASAIHDVALMDASVRRVDEGLRAHEELFTEFARLFGRRMRAPFTVSHLVAVTAALAEGFALQDCTRTRHPRIDRDGLGDGVGRDWTLYGTALHFLIEAFTEPDASSPDTLQAGRRTMPSCATEATSTPSAV
jgi:AcrR family transcriptional regulator